MNTSYLVASCSDEINSIFKNKLKEHSGKPNDFFDELPYESRRMSTYSYVEIEAAKGRPIIYCSDSFDSKLFTIVQLLKDEDYYVNAHILIYDKLNHRSALSSMYQTIDNVASIFKTCSSVTVWFYNAKTGNFIRILKKHERTNYHLEKYDIKNYNLDQCVKYICSDLKCNNFTEK